jgi:CRISPR-associated protein Cas2
MYFVVAYDIEQDRRRNKVMNALKDFGLRVQYSVFECELDPGRIDALRQRLRSLIEPQCDKIHIYPLCDACFFRSESLGLEKPIDYRGQARRPRRPARPEPKEARRGR